MRQSRCYPQWTVAVWKYKQEVSQTGIAFGKEHHTGDIWSSSKVYASFWASKLSMGFFTLPVASIPAPSHGRSSIHVEQIVTFSKVEALSSKAVNYSTNFEFIKLNSKSEKSGLEMPPNIFSFVFTSIFREKVCCSPVWFPFLHQVWSISRMIGTI